MRFPYLPLIVSICLFPAISPAQEAPPASAVDPLIGTAPNPFTKIGYTFDTGNVYPGAVCPHGMVAWSPDTTHANNIAGGYWYPDDKILDFSLTHFSGRGVPCLKEIAFQPVLQPVTAPGTGWNQYAATFSHQNETALPGYYRVKLDNGVQFETTTTPRTGMARFTFPAQSSAALLLRVNGSVTVSGSEVSGFADTRIVKGGQPYKLYFAAEFEHPIKSVQTWVGDTITSSPTAQGPISGAILTFDTSTAATVPVRVGISYTSLENARENLNVENRASSFDIIRVNAANLWNKELSRVTLQGGSADARRIFYTALYHCFIHPTFLEDDNGQFLGMDRQVHTVPKGHHQYQNIPAWDQHRSQSPLIAILAPKESADMMQSLVNYAQEDASVRPSGGGLPRWEQVNANSGGMVGDGDDTIIATASAFGVDGFDKKAALASMDKGASQPGTTSDGKKVRDGLDKYTTLGYVPEKAAVTLEYCTDDFSLSQFAKSLGDSAKAAAYLKRAQDWKNLYDPATGYIRPKLATGAFMDPFKPSDGKGFIEGTAGQYVWMVNFNLRGLIDRMGGDQKVNARLDQFFTKTNAGLRSDMAYMGNEPCEETPWVYDFTGNPAGTQAVVRRIQKELFTTKPSGIPGNDDAGATSSWYVFSALGLYPEIPGVAGLVTGSPVFPKATIHLDNGSSIQIIGENASPENCYVQSLRVNGAPHDSPWIPWALLAHGGTVDFVLGPKPSAWGIDPAKAPPSFDVP